MLAMVHLDWRDGVILLDALAGPTLEGASTGDDPLLAMGVCAPAAAAAGAHDSPVTTLRQFTGRQPGEGICGPLQGATQAADTHVSAIAIDGPGQVDSSHAGGQGLPIPPRRLMDMRMRWRNQSIQEVLH